MHKIYTHTFSRTEDAYRMITKYMYFGIIIKK